MTTNILANGSKWAGQSPDPIEKLFEVLKAETLEPLWGHPIQTNPELLDGSLHWGTIFGGNFCNLSHVFRIETDDAELIKRLTDALNANMQTDAYKQACIDHDAYVKEREQRAIHLLEQAQRKRISNAKRTLGLI